MLDLTIKQATEVPVWSEAIAEAGFEALDELGFQVGKSDIGTDDLKKVFYAMLAAAPAQPALQGEQQPVGEMISNDGDIYWADRHPPMGTKLYAAPIAQTVQPEVQRLREALERATKLLSAAAGYATKMEPMPAKLLNAIDAELDASTGQEVEK